MRKRNETKSRAIREQFNRVQFVHPIQYANKPRVMGTDGEGVNVQHDVFSFHAWERRNRNRCRTKELSAECTTPPTITQRIASGGGRSGTDEVKPQSVRHNFETRCSAGSPRHGRRPPRRCSLSCSSSCGSWCTCRPARSPCSRCGRVRFVCGVFLCGRVGWLGARTRVLPCGGTREGMRAACGYVVCV